MLFAFIEISTLFLAIIIAVVLYVTFKNGIQLAMNTVFGALVLIAAIGGVFKALLIIILNYLAIGFL